MFKYKNVFVNNIGCAGWIMQFLADDICIGTREHGFICNMGAIGDYNNEDIAIHMTWRGAAPFIHAKHNSVFITHVDDSLLEKDLLKLKGKFDSYLTMSKEDATFLIELGFDKEKVFGVTLPTRNTYIRPVSIGIFSACYSDHRKNENWLYEYCKNNENASLLNYIFIGTGWGEFVNKMSSIGMSFVWYNISRSLPSEYMYQQLELSRLDYYLYMGMEGGGMGTYDAYAMGVPLCVADDGYHKEIPDIEFRFETKEQFFKSMDLIVSKQKRRVAFFKEYNRDKYASKLLDIWNGKYKEEGLYSESDSTFKTVVEKRRYNYACWLDYSRIKYHIVPFIHQFLNRLRYKNIK